jgi:Tol biopolymer transport system component
MLLTACGRDPSAGAACEPVAAVEGLTALRQYDVFRLYEDGSLERLTEDLRSFSPAVLPDGSGIVVTRGVEGSHDECCGYAETFLDVLDLNGVVIASIPREHGWNDSSAAVSPDGSRLAFVRRAQADAGAKLMVAEVDGSNARAVTTFGGERPGVPSWSPDGEHLAVTTGDTSALEAFVTLRLIDPDDGTATEVVAGGVFGDPAWSADGAHIVLSGRDYESPTSLFEVTTDGGAVREIAQPAQASRTNAFYGLEDSLVSLRYQQTVQPDPQLFETIDRHGKAVSDVTIEQVKTDEGGTVLVGSLSLSSCFLR